MSSVTRFIRQVPVSTTYYNAAAVLGAASTMVFELVPSAANIIGNYPPGYVKAAGADLQGALAAAVSAYTAANLVLRDMGKTIYAQYGTGAASDPSAYFRQVQLIHPTGNSTDVQDFGVFGSQNFLTFYIPVAVAGVKGPQVNTQAFAIAGGQM